MAEPQEPRQAGGRKLAGLLPWWKRRSRKAKAGIIVGAIIVALLAIGLLAPPPEENTAAEATTTDATTTEAATTAPTTTARTTTQATTTAKTERTASPPKPKRKTPKQRVQQAVGDEVAAGGYAGDVKIHRVEFEGREAQITAQTPEGGFQGTSCGDLDDASRAIFETVFNDGGWGGGAMIVYKGGLVDSSTGEELPGANTGIYTMPPGKADRINWADEDVLLTINWALYRDFCHPALKQ